MSPCYGTQVDSALWAMRLAVVAVVTMKAIVNLRGGLYLLPKWFPQNFMPKNLYFFYASSLMF